MEHPPGITYKAEYEPDSERMTKALQILKEAPFPKEESQEDIQEGA
jgi:hypothetical protein